MDVGQAAAVRTRHLARPGRTATVITDLANLHAPVTGTVRLPRLYWSGLSPAFDLSDPFLRRWLCQIVLRQASRPKDLTANSDGGTLIQLWPALFLLRGVRQAWQELHPGLRAAESSPEGE